MACHYSCEGGSEEGWRAEVLLHSENGVWVQPGGVEDRRGEKPEDVMPEEVSGTSLEENMG